MAYRPFAIGLVCAGALVCGCATQGGRQAAQPSYAARPVQMGVTLETALAAQIANPDAATGTPREATTDGTVIAAAIQRYQTDQTKPLAQNRTSTLGSRGGAGGGGN